ncbi:putative F-box domain, leucine-rich repeat domain superfamily, F-box-like domain superfamily [Helianthus debilis subsp. tardiflorus]
MDSSHGKKRMNVEDDRLSGLPDELIHKILSFIGIKQAIQTSVLSSRWRFIWTSMPYLNFSRDDFHRLHNFSEFVTHVLSGRNNQAEVSSVKLSFHGEDAYVIAEQIMKYAFSHNMQKLNVACVFDDDNVKFPLFLSSSRSLKHLSVTKERFPLTVYRWRHPFSYAFKATSILELPALTTLYLHDVTFCCDENPVECIDLFSKCANLKSLTLKGCYIYGITGIRIRLPLLSNLTLESVGGNVEVFGIVAPQLKNLTIRGSFVRDHEYLISAPDLVFLLYSGYDHLKLYTNGFLSLEKADICVSSPKDAHQVLRLLQHLHRVKSLTLNLEIVELLSSSVELMSHKPSPFVNLKSLKIHPAREEVPEHDSVKMYAEVKSYLLDGSSGATFTMVTREEIRATRNTKLAQNRITTLHALLEQEKARIETKLTKIAEQRSLPFSECIDSHIDMCWKYTSVQIKTGKEKASNIISELQEIKDLLAKLPASNLATVQSSFSTLCAEADIVTRKIAECIKMDCDEGQRRLSMCIHELAAPLQPPS